MKSSINQINQSVRTWDCPSTNRLYQLTIFINQHEMSCLLKLLSPWCREPYLSLTPDLEALKAGGPHSSHCHTYLHFTTTTIIACALNAPPINSPTSLISSRLIAPLLSSAHDCARITACVSLPRPRLEALCTTPTAPNNNVFPFQIQQKGLFANHQHPPARFARHSLIGRPAEPDPYTQWCPERRETWVTAACRKRKW